VAATSAGHEPGDWLHDSAPGLAIVLLGKASTLRSSSGPRPCVARFTMNVPSTSAGMAEQAAARQNERSGVGRQLLATRPLRALGRVGGRIRKPGAVWFASVGPRNRIHNLRVKLALHASSGVPWCRSVRKDKGFLPGLGAVPVVPCRLVSLGVALWVYHQFYGFALR
jgi:hypothetical protein